MVDDSEIYINLIDNPYRSWFKRNINLSILNKGITRGISEGYELTNTGFLVKDISTDEEKGEITHIQAKTFRPVDFHIHNDVEERIKILDGEGNFYTRKLEERINKGQVFIVPVYCSHSFRPNINDFLEIDVKCNGILDDEQEVCIKRFDEFEPWVKYYTHARALVV